MSRRRFCMLTTFYPPFNFGGDGVFVRRLANSLARRGHEVHVVHERDAFETLAPEPPPDPAYADDPRITHHPLRRSRARLADLLLSHQLGRPVAMAEDLRRVLRTVQPDVIHFHNISLLGGPGVLGLGDAVKLCTLHDYWFICPMHTLWRFDREACGRRTCLPCTLHGRRPPQLWRYGRRMERMIQQLDFLLAPSRFSFEAHRTHLPSSPLRLLPHFAPEPQPVAESDASENGDRPFFLFVGRLEKLKGAHDLIQAFRPFEGADLLIAGRGSWEARLRRDTADLDRIRFLGWVEEGRLQRLLAAATAVVVPSLCYETFGLVAVEAFARGTPVLLRRLGALPELVEQHGGGLLYETHEELRTAMRTLLERPELRAKLAQEGRSAYHGHYSAEVHLDRYLALIDEAEASRGRGAAR